MLFSKKGNIKEIENYVAMEISSEIRWNSCVDKSQFISKCIYDTSKIGKIGCGKKE